MRKKTPTTGESSGKQAKLWRGLQSPRRFSIPSVMTLDFTNSRKGSLAEKMDTCPLRPRKSAG